MCSSDLLLPFTIPATYLLTVCVVYGRLAGDNEIIAGHTRFAAAQKLKLDKVPVRWLDLDPADAHALALADNKVGEIATWDDAALRKVLADLNDADETLLADTGFNNEEIARYLEFPKFDELDGDPTRLDQKKPICCPKCGHEWKQ